MKNGLYFSCQIGGLPTNTFDVAEFHLNEKLSELFELTLTLVSHNANINIDDLLLLPASLTITVNDIKQRTIAGIVARAEHGDSGFRRTFYTLTIRPEMWTMTLNQESRIYHQRSVPQVLTELLQQNQIQASCVQLKDAHQPREFVTQKRESDYQFFCRLASEEGVVFWFDADGMQYSDTHLAMSGTDLLFYNPHPKTAMDGDIIHSLRFGASMRPGKTAHKDRNYHIPDYFLEHSAETENVSNSHTVFESYGRFQKDAEAAPMVKYRLEQLRSDSRAGHAQSNCIRLMPGYMFRITEHPLQTMNDLWQITAIEHHGKMPEALEEEDNQGGTTLTNSFSFMSGKADWRAPFIFKPQADGDEVAEVVGPKGEEIYVDADGAVKVFFHWNRYDAEDDKASCWVRVAQGWNGNGFGFLATPRIGQEVIVSYLNGDIDRPIITGCTYNGNNRPPLNLPAEKTKTTFKTKTHKGDGFNELRFEDEAGREEVYIHAQKDMSTDVLNNRSTTVDANHTEHVKKNQAVTVDKNQITTVKKNQIIHVHKNEMETVNIAKKETIGVAKILSVGSLYQTVVGGIMNTSVALIEALQVGVRKSLTVGKNYTANIGKKMSVSVGERKTESAGKVSVYSAGEHLELSCGGARIVLTKQGNIHFIGNTINLQSSLALSGDSTLINWNCGATLSPPELPKDTDPDGFDGGMGGGGPSGAGGPGCY